MPFALVSGHDFSSTESNTVTSRTIRSAYPWQFPAPHRMTNEGATLGRPTPPAGGCESRMAVDSLALLRDDSECKAWPQTVEDKYGSVSQRPPNYQRQRHHSTPPERSLLYRHLQSSDGHWAGEYADPCSFFPASSSACTSQRRPSRRVENRSCALPLEPRRQAGRRLGDSHRRLLDGLWHSAQLHCVGLVGVPLNIQ